MSEALPAAGTPARNGLPVLSAGLAVATAAWLIPASVHIVQWPVEGPVRLALLSPAWQLALWLAAGVTAALGLWLSGAARHVSVWPLSLLWLWAVPFLPWLPDQLPLLLVLAGPGRWVIALVAVGLGLRRYVPLTLLAAPLARLGRPTVFAASLVVYLGFGLYAASALSTGGDEPHYLIITESLIRDGDLQIENNHANRDYLPFFGGTLRPDFFVRGVNGAIYSIHAPGLPALVAPAYLIGGRVGVVVFIALLAALAALAIFDLAARIAGPATGAVTWAACCFTVPFIPYAWLIFPEVPGACLVAWAVRWTYLRQDRPVWVWVSRGLLLALLPWLHTKFVVFLAIFAVALAWPLRRDARRLAGFAAPIALSGVAWLYSFYAIYGVFSPEAPYGAYSATYVLTRNIPHGLLGIFFDQKFGLLPYSPIYLVAIPGTWLLWRRADTRHLAVVLALAVAMFVGSTARLYMFWGGTSAPARFLVPIVPCLAPMVALGVEAARTALARALVSAWVTVGLVFGAMGMGWPARLLLFSVDHGRARVLELLQGGAPLAMSVPTFTEPDWASEVPRFAVWSLVAAASLWAGSTAASRRAGAWQALGVACAVFGVGGAVVSARPSGEARADAVRRGALAVLWRFDGSRFRTLDYRSFSRVTAARLQELTTVDVTRRVADDRGGVLGDVLPLPAGAYDAVVSFKGNAHLPTDLLVSDPPAAQFARLDAVAGLSARLPFLLPMAARRLTVAAGRPEVAGDVSQITLVPRSVVPPREREDHPVRLIESIPDRPAAFLGYTDEHVYPEKGAFWSRGLGRPLVYLAPGGFTRLTLTLSTGPLPSRVTLTVGSEQRIVAMPGGRDVEETFQLPSDLRLIPVTVQSSTMFRPSEVDASSSDGRGLGCQVRVSLE